MHSTDAESGAVIVARPILKWAGGKRQLLPALRRHYPKQFERFLEPFLGSGAVYLDLHNRGLLENKVVWLSDINADVIGCYKRVRDSVGEVIAELRRLQAGHREAGAAHFYEVRDGHFNEGRSRLPAGAGRADAYTPALAAMLIYLNRTGYNGLFRVNARGAFNVPAGRYGRITICDGDNLERLSAALRRPGLRLDAAGFEVPLSACGPGDFVYLDPPYAPLSPTSRFTSYTAGGFGPDQQHALQQAVVAAAARRAAILLSNSAAPEIRQLYAASPEARVAGLRPHTVFARRAINSRALRRGRVREYVITNVG